MEARDLPGTVKTKYWTGFVYPKVPRRRLPLVERDVETRETLPPYRYGVGISVRVPFTRRALVVGRWAGEIAGDTDDEKLRNAIRASEPEVSVDTIAGW